jgi:phosphoglycolate phosphatase-like HAD superfamily hydrolase
MKRLLLFDIDGTLVWGGPAKKAFELAMESVFGTAGPIVGHDFSGKTDPQIARELLQLEGLADHVIEAGFVRLWREYLGELESRLTQMPMTVLPGVRALLGLLDSMDGVALGLLTGNIAAGAHLKLGSVGLLDYFHVGGYGSDSELRKVPGRLRSLPGGMIWRGWLLRGPIGSWPTLGIWTSHWMPFWRNGQPGSWSPAIQEPIRAARG